MATQPPPSSTSTKPTPTPTTTTTSTPPSNPPPPPTPLRPIFLTLLIACPMLMLLPPRKLDLYTFSLAGAWVVSAEELSIGSAARRRGQRGAGMDSWGGMGMGMFGRKREGQGRQGQGRESDADGDGDKGGEEEGEGEEEGVKGLAKKLWMGDERPGWQRRRLEREREELESGKGYGDMIMEQVREVFPRFGGRREGGDGEGKEG